MTMAPPFIPYYIDYNVKNLSKTIGVSKKKVTFKFGVANRQAIDEGLVGAHCRGSEHECVFTWSLNSGKRHVTMDGKDVHFSTSGQNGWTSDRTWQHVFSLKVPGYDGTFRCHIISQPAPSGSNIRPFDLRVGGVSIFKFNQIYQLGTQQMVVRQPGGRPSHGGGDEPMSPEERRMLEVARVESMREYQEQQARSSTTGNAGPPGTVHANGRTPAPAGGEDLLMSFNEVASPPVPAGMPPAGFVSSMTLGSEFSSSNSFQPPGNPGQQPFGYPQQQQQQPNGYPQQQYQQPNGYPQQQYQQPNGYPQQQQQQQQQPNYGQSPPYGSPGGLAQQQSFGGWSASTAPTTNTTAMTPYQAQPGQAQPSQFAMNSFTSSTNSFSGMTAPTQASTKAPSLAASLDPYAAPPADPFASPSAMQSSYGQMPAQQQPQYGGYAGQPGQFQPLQSPAAETQASFGTYGSTPSFARPPPTGQPQYQQSGGYGQPPAPVGAYSAPPQYQQQQYQQTGF
jgi:hypothetical protein